MAILNGVAAGGRSGNGVVMAVVRGVCSGGGGSGGKKRDFGDGGWWLYAALVAEWNRKGELERGKITEKKV